MDRRITAALLLIGSFSITGCSLMTYGPHSYAPQRIAAPAQMQPPVGRWDLVMSLQDGLIVSVLDSSGEQHTGRFLGADRDRLRLVKSGHDLTVARLDVMRVDLAQRLPASKNTVKRIGASAVIGALANGGLTSLIGSLMTEQLRVGGPQSWLAGAAAGAMVAVERDFSERQPRTIYLAPIRP